jgi:hypothetical protein
MLSGMVMVFGGARALGSATVMAVVLSAGASGLVPRMPVVPLLVLVAGAIMAAITRPWRRRNPFGEG